MQSLPFLEKNKKIILVILSYIILPYTTTKKGRQAADERGKGKK